MTSRGTETKDTNVRIQTSNTVGDTVGTLTWARRTGGKLSAADRRRLALEGISAQLRRMPRQLRRWLGLPRASAPFDVDPLRLPDTAMAKAAEDALRESSPEPLILHTYRTYAWGRILAAQAGHGMDDELFYVASLLHDLGLVLEEDQRPTGSCCFAYDGAEAALGVMQKAGMDAVRSERVAEAISLHLNANVPLSQGVEARYLNAGAALDVIGLNKSRIPADWLRRVLEAYPRDGWREEIGPLLLQEVETRPGSRIHFLFHRFQFGKRAQAVRF